MRTFFLLIITSILFLYSASSFSHQLSTSYITLNNDTNKNQYIGDWQVNIADLEQIVPLDLDQNGQISWAEIKAKRSSINQFISASLTLSQTEQVCALSSEATYQLDNHFNQPYLVIPLLFNCDSNNSVTLNYSAFFKTDANHKAIVNINNVSRVFNINDAKQTFSVTQSSYLSTFSQYVYQGVIHILIGVDHILFLIALLLPCVLTRTQKQWQGITSKKQIIKHTAWIVTAFTLAHSITLTATALNLVSPNSRWVELGIAISVLFAALNNVWPVVLRLGWLTFAFGLLHGMGFASVLGELGLSSDYQLLSILAFNLGVEFGQLSILLVALPLLIWVRNYDWYKKWLMPIGSIAIALIALQWSIERF
ncbi:HupE/UreJ family protein [Pseudoalteromonas sp. TB64]|uniref:HupE/UreJ family protein n=1 Tax=Pseudoalteromonas sp. TB64 TaxID=1938600 RepID=UPI00040B0DC9|nr:HupE/UreJ family protein [Pseudoalteromonas sp. TB64]